jgi:hypothetical protein
MVNQPRQGRAAVGLYLNAVSVDTFGGEETLLFRHQ